MSCNVRDDRGDLSTLGALTDVCPGCGLKRGSKEWPQTFTKAGIPNGHYHCGICHETFPDGRAVIDHWGNEPL